MREENKTYFLWLGFLWTCSTAIIPLLLYKSLPLLDLPNHMARHYLMAHGQAGPLQQYYAKSEAVFPNSAVDYLWSLFGYPGDVERFSQLTIVFQSVALIVAIMVLARVMHKSWTFWSLAGGLLVWNLPMLNGFQNFTFALPFAILALALWIACEHRPVAQRITLFLPVAFLLMVMHFFAFLAFATCAFGRQAQLLWEARQDRKAVFLQSMVLSVVFLMPLAWLMGNISSDPYSVAGHRTEYGDVVERLVILLSPVLGAYKDGSTLLLFSGLAAGILLYGSFLTLVTRRTGPRIVLAPVLYGPVIALALAVLIMPGWLNGIALAHVRLPVALLAILIAGSRWEGCSTAHLKLVAAIVVSLMIVRAIAFAQTARVHSDEVAQLRQVLAYLPQGSRLLPLRAEGKQSNSRLEHVDAYAIIDRQSFIPDLFQGTHAITVRDTWLDYTHPYQSAVDECYVVPQACPNSMLNAQYIFIHPHRNYVFFEKWPCKFTHVLMYDRSARYIPNLPFVQHIKSAGRFTLYAVNPKALAWCKN